jgi:hypothetical protein
MCNHVNSTKHRADIGRLSSVTCCFLSFADIQGRRTGCAFLDLGNGVSLSPSLGTRGGLCRMRLLQQWNLSMNILWAGKCCERLCGDLLAMHQMKRTLGKMETFSHLASGEITNLWVKLCNFCRVWTVMIAVLTVMSGMDLCHDSLGLVGLDLLGLSLVHLVHGMQQVWSLCACFGLATGGMPVSIGRFWLHVWLLWAWGPWLPWVISVCGHA